MKKCSQTSHYALTELNITPLLDLAFVLLVIFIVTTTPVAHQSDVQLPTASQHPKDPPRKANSITLRPDGTLWVNNLQVQQSELQKVLAEMRQLDPDLTIIIYSDAKTPYREVRSVLEACQQANLFKVDLATQAASVPSK